MKKSIFLLLVLTLMGGALFAQRPQRQAPPQKIEVTQMVSNLTAKQKKQLEALSDESSARVERYRKELEQVRDSIHRYMTMDGDHSAVLFPLIDKESDLHGKIAKELYTTRTKIDKILTKEQRAELKAKLKQNREKARQKASSPAPKTSK